MIKKAVLVVVATMLIVFGASIAYANQIDGMASGAIGTLALPTSLQASVNPGGLGDALIFGYYNARDTFNFIRIVNTSETTAVKARVRFREGVRSKEVLDFNICLSNKDEWSAIVFTPTENGPAMILPWDEDTMTAPVIPASGQDFIYSSSGLSGLSDVSASDTREGYLEVLATISKGGGTETNHITWTVDECTNQLTMGATVPTANTGGPVYADAPNSLAGNNFILTFNGAYSYNAAAIANCELAADFPIANETPTFVNCFDGLVGIDYILTKQTHMAMYNVQQVPLEGETEVVITFPTKKLHVTGAAADSAGRYVYSKPFDTADLTRCEPVSINKYDDEEDTTISQTGFSPSGSQGFALCNEVNVIKINNSAITIQSTEANKSLEASIDVTDVTTPTNLGWVKLGLDTGTMNCTTGNSVCVSPRQSFGLPSLGFVLQNHIGWESGMDSTMYRTDIE